MPRIHSTTAGSTDVVPAYRSEGVDISVTNITTVYVRFEAVPRSVSAWLRRRWPLLGLLVVLLVAGGAQALQINPTFVIGEGEIWDSTREGVINQAIADWELAVLDNQTVDVAFTFFHAGTGGYLGQWRGNGSFDEDTDIYPWTDGLSHMIRFNADLFFDAGSGYLWWDPTPDTADDQPVDAWDALSVARHELGHMLGFTDGFYVDHFFTPQEVDRWQDPIVGTTFDPGGLDVTMASASDLGHVADSGSTAGDLMTQARVNGVRADIRQIDLDMLALAHGYTVRVGLLGDLNDDGFVGQKDLDIVLAEWGHAGSAITDPRADVNGDDFIGQGDLDNVLVSWGQSAPPPAVPEPATLSLLSLCGLVFLRRRPPPGMRLLNVQE